MRVYRNSLSVAAFSLIKLLYSAFMPILNYIDCRAKRMIKAYAFAPFIFNKSLVAGNISVFKNFNIIQIGTEKMDKNWCNWVTI